MKKSHRPAPYTSPVVGFSATRRSWVKFPPAAVLPPYVFSSVPAALNSWMRSLSESATYKLVPSLATPYGRLNCPGAVPDEPQRAGVPLGHVDVDTFTGP